MELTQDTWAAYFRGITNAHRQLVAIESVGPRARVEERIEAMCEGVCTRHPLRAIAYEQRADVFEVAAGLAAEQGPLLRYLVAAPRRIVVKEERGVRAIAVTDAGGGRTLVCVFSTEPRGSRSGARIRSIDGNNTCFQRRARERHAERP